MGAAGYVTIYEEAAVRDAYVELWEDFGHKIEEDWWYPSWGEAPRWPNVRVNLKGVWYLVDYADDQGGHEGVHEPYWFDPVPLVETGETWPNGNPKKVFDPVELARQWEEIDQRAPLSDQPWVTQPKNRMGGEYADVYPSQARVLLALRRAGGQKTEVWT